MESTALSGTTKPINLDAIALAAAQEVMGINPDSILGPGQLTARIQVIIREAIASATSNDIAMYWHGRAKDMQVMHARAGEELARAQRALRHAGFTDGMLGWQATPGTIEDVRSQLAQMEEVKDGAYEERNMVVAALAKCFPSGTAKTAIEGWAPEWHNCVYIDLPTGQASWHYHDDHAPLFADLPPYKGKWDGHSTPAKYTRLAALKLWDVFTTAAYRMQNNGDGTEQLMFHNDFVEYGTKAYRDGYRDEYDIDYEAQLTATPGAGEQPLLFYTFKASGKEVITAGLQALRKASWCTILPARTVRLHIHHDTIGDGIFTPLMNDALREFMDGDPRGERMTFRAENGVRIEVESMPQMSIEELVEGKVLKK
jgi:hypothetical protein